MAGRGSPWGWPHHLLAAGQAVPCKGMAPRPRLSVCRGRGGRKLSDRVRGAPELGRWGCSCRWLPLRCRQEAQTLLWSISTNLTLTFASVS